MFSVSVAQAKAELIVKLRTTDEAAGAMDYR